MDDNEADFQEMKNKRFLYFDNSYCLILAGSIVICLSFFIIYGNFVEYIAVKINFCNEKLCIIPL